MKRNVNILLLMIVAACGVSLWQALTGDPAADDATGDMTVAPAPPPVERAEAGAGSPWLGADAANIHLVILNGTAVPGLARDVSLALSRVGCVTQRVGNAPHQEFDRTLLVNRRLDAQQAERLAAQLGGIAVIEEKDSRTHEDALLVLGADYRVILQALDLPAVPSGRAN